MGVVDSAGDIIPKFAGTVGKVSDFIANGVGNFITFGNIVFVVLLILILVGLYKIWRMEVKTKEYFRRRNREI